MSTSLVASTLGASRVLVVTSAVAELGAGLALLVAPALTARLILGGLPGLESALLARVAGAALLALGLICWLERDRDERAQRAGIVAGLLIYNLAVAGLLTESALATRMHGVALWPVVLVHVTLLGWCALLVRSTTPAVTRR